MPAELQKYLLKRAPVYNKANKLGEGRQAAVQEGTFEGKPVTVKVIKDDAESMLDASNEVILTKQISHLHIVEILGVYLGPEGMSIVMELGSDSLEGLIGKRNDPLTPREMVTYGFQIALNYCVTEKPKKPIHHYDLKTENILIVNDHAKLADFGLSQNRK